MNYLWISAAIVAVAVLVFAFTLGGLVDESDAPLAEDGGPYVEEGEAPVMQEPPAN